MGRLTNDELVRAALETPDQLTMADTRRLGTLADEAHQEIERLRDELELERSMFMETSTRAQLLGAERVKALAERDEARHEVDVQTRSLREARAARDRLSDALCSATATNERLVAELLELRDQRGTLEELAAAHRTECQRLEGIAEGLRRSEARQRERADKLDAQLAEAMAEVERLREAKAEARPEPPPELETYEPTDDHSACEIAALRRALDDQTDEARKLLRTLAEIEKLAERAQLPF